MRDVHVAQYGGTNLTRAFCEDCKVTAFVIDGELQCCGKEVSVPTDLPVQRASLGRYKRQIIPLAVKQQILVFQEGKCFWCNNKLNSFYFRKNDRFKVRKLVVHFDHVLPFSFAHTLHHNIVASCDICNLAKRNKVFNNVEEIRVYCKDYISRLITFVRG